MSRLMYDRPATIWNEALPLGNGSLGAMVYGGHEQEMIKLNLDTLWAGTVRPEPKGMGVEFHEHVRRLIFEGKMVEACRYMEENVPRNNCYPYLPMGCIDMRFDKTQMADDYRRELDLETATLTVENRTRSRGKKPMTKRQYFVSYPHGVMVCRMTTEDAVGLSFCIRTDSDLQYTVKDLENGFSVMGRAPRTTYVYDSDDTIRFCYTLACFPEDGTVSVANGKCTVLGAHALTLVLAAETDFVSYDKIPDKNKDLEGVCRARIDRAMADGIDEVYRAHVADYRALFDRVELTLEGEDRSHIPTDRRLAAFDAEHPDPELVKTLFDYGRYLMIACSREGTQPANLQGLWSANRFPDWNCNYTVNINTEMNYWPVEACGLSECHEPLFDMLRELSEVGERTAKKLYGCRGFVLNHSTDIWRKTVPSGGLACYSYWPASGGWLCSHLWMRFAYTEDMDFLRDTAFPITEKSARFYLDFLVPAPDGSYATAPSTSPENSYLHHGEVTSVCYGSTMDMSIIRELFTHLIKMAEILGTETEVVREAREMLPRLRKPRLASDGRLCEWHEEFPEREEGHRHLSHLYGVFPGDVYGPEDPEFEAARKSLMYRIAKGSGHTGWSGAWILNLLAIFGEREMVWDMLVKFFSISLYPNLFDRHPPFQIDGNFGMVMAICNMLVQERGDQVVLLPALPEVFPNGEIKGLRLRGRRVLDFAWKDGKVTYSEIRSI